MKQEIPNISYERSMNHNYLILSTCDYFGKKDAGCRDYRTKMLLENQIPGLLPVTHRQINGESRYYYEINSLQSLDRLYDKNGLGYDALRRLLFGCVSLFDRLEEYLLDGSQIIIKPELIYMNVDKMEPYFVCYPEYEGDVRLGFMEFIDMLLTRLDHTDEQAVMIGYQVYRYTRNPNYVISEVARIIESDIVTMTKKEPSLQKYSADEQEISSTKKSCYAVYTDNRYIQEEDLYYKPKREEIYEEEEQQSEKNSQKTKAKNIADLAGGTFCVFVSLCAGIIILGARVLKTFQLSESNELYLYGALGMAMMAAALFFSCYIKKRKQDKELERLRDNGDTDCCCDKEPLDEEYEYFKSRESVQKKQNIKETAEKVSISRSASHRSVLRESYDDTECLGGQSVEERVLCGRINGKEVSVSLDKLPMIVGKLPSVSDFVINDTAVSKMHARFEEHDGKVYVCDLNSTNGTVRNGVLLGVNQSVALEPGDRLRFGRTCFTYC
ncbi:MAG: FHA domain-containing protein [Lachnospiraceae bacterium]|nr:FHA domain-containing protein [Lachnospiraceae bacterium]